MADELYKELAVVVVPLTEAIQFVNAALPVGAVYIPFTIGFTGRTNLALSTVQYRTSWKKKTNQCTFS